MFFFCGLHLAWTIWLTLPACNKWSWERMTVWKQFGCAISFISILGKKGACSTLTEACCLSKVLSRTVLIWNAFGSSCLPQNHMPGSGKHLCPKEGSSGHPHGLSLSLGLIPTSYLERKEGLSPSWAVSIAHDSVWLSWRRIWYG